MFGFSNTDNELFACYDDQSLMRRYISDTIECSGEYRNGNDSVVFKRIASGLIQIKNKTTLFQTPFNELYGSSQSPKVYGGTQASYDNGFILEIMNWYD